MKCDVCGEAVTELTTARPLCERCKHGLPPLAKKMKTAPENKMVTVKKNKTVEEDDEPALS